MYKASADVTLPTSIIGSLPRPSWYTAGLGTQNFLEAMMNSALPRAIRGCGLGLSACPGDRRARHCDRRRRAFRRADQRHELAELSADPYGRVLQGGDAQRLSDGRRWAAARPYPARLSRSAGIAADRRPGRPRQPPIRGDVEDGATADQEAGQVRHDPAGTARRLGRRRLLQRPGRTGLGAERRAQPGTPSTGRCRLPGDPIGGAADPHGAGARQDLRQARRGRTGRGVQQHSQRAAAARPRSGATPAGAIRRSSGSFRKFRATSRPSPPSIGSRPTRSPSRPAPRAPAICRRSARR